MPAHRVEYEPVAVPSGIRLGLGMTPFGAITLAGSQNWFELLTASKVFSVRRKAQVGYNKTKYVKPRRHRSRTFDDIIFTKAETIEKERKKTPPQSKVDSLRKPPTSAKPRVPAINIIKASNESIPDMYISESSEEESDYEDGEDFVYECPGLAASAEDMTVENPLFQEKHFQCSYRTPELPKKYWKDVFVESV